MKRSFIAAITSVALVAGGAWAVAAFGADVAVVTGPSQGLTRSTKYWTVGPSATYDFDNGGIGTVSPLRVTLAPGSSDVVVTISMDYRTSPDDRFVAGLYVRRDRRYGHLVPVIPNQRAIAASSARSSATLMFQLTDLPGGHTYLFFPSVNVSHRDNKASIEASRVLMTVDSTPRA
jgi:hypothetical protein